MLRTQIHIDIHIKHQLFKPAAMLPSGVNTHHPSNRQQCSHRESIPTIRQTGSTSPIGSQYPPSIKPSALLPLGVSTVLQTVSTSPFRRGPSSAYLTNPSPHQEECATDNLHKQVVKHSPAINPITHSQLSNHRKREQAG